MFEFTEEQLVSFGNFLLDKYHKDESVGDWDIRNWKETPQHKQILSRIIRSEKIKNINANNIQETKKAESI